MGPIPHRTPRHKLPEQAALPPALPRGHTPDQTPRSQQASPVTPRQPNRAPHRLPREVPLLEGRTAGRQAGTHPAARHPAYAAVQQRGTRARSPQSAWAPRRSLPTWPSPHNPPALRHSVTSQLPGAVADGRRRAPQGRTVGSARATPSTQQSQKTQQESQNDHGSQNENHTAPTGKELGFN